MEENCVRFMDHYKRLEKKHINVKDIINSVRLVTNLVSLQLCSEGETLIYSASACIKYVTFPQQCTVY